MWTVISSEVKTLGFSPLLEFLNQMIGVARHSESVFGLLLQSFGKLMSPPNACMSHGTTSSARCFATEIRFAFIPQTIRVLFS